MTAETGILSGCPRSIQFNYARNRFVTDVNDPIITPATGNAPTPPATPDDYSADDAVITVSRTTFNYVLIGVSFFVVGLMLGFLGYDRFATNNAEENAALMLAAAQTAVAGVPRGNTVAAAPTRDPNARYAVAVAENPSIGSPDAPITIIEFGDFRCSYCKRFYDQTLNPLLEQYGDQVRFVYRDYPILGPDSTLAAMAGECADDQGKFWDFHDLIYADQVLTRDQFLEYAATLEMDVDAFTNCLDEGTHTAEIQADYQAGSSVGVGGTPTFFINGRMLVGAQPISTFSTMIEDELIRLNSTPATEEASGA
jgi:protein-disulfide isomerase